MKQETFSIPETVEGRAEIMSEVAACIMNYKPGKKLEVTVAVEKKDRSNPQCRYLNGVAIPEFVKSLGNSSDDWREYFNGEFFGWKSAKQLNGVDRVEPIRTTTTDEEGERNVIDGETFWKLVRFIQDLGAQSDIYIPDPDPRYFMRGIDTNVE